jgi:hypothetical protein
VTPQIRAIARVLCLGADRPEGFHP